jgi:glycerol-3-phosphate acyltransferase PlsX
MRIAVDAMGGDHAPREVVAGAVEAARTADVEVLLVGDEAQIRAELERHPGVANVTVHHAADVIDMGASARTVLQKQNASIHVATRLVREQAAGAVVTAGDTGAALIAGMKHLQTIPGVDRPGLALHIPTPQGRACIIDVGGYVDCQPRHLLQFAHLASIYSARANHLPTPRIGLLNNGEEETKGNALTKETFALLRQSPLNFVGNVDAKDIFRGTADVIVCDGFSGNILLKVAEATAEFVCTSLRQELSRKGWCRLVGLMLKPSLRRFRQRLEYSEYGGALFLGLNGAVIISHGRSDRRAMANAIRVAAEAVQANVTEYIQQQMHRLAAA